MKHLQLSDTLITALARLVDDGQLEVKREPTHSTLSFHFQQAGLAGADPQSQGQVLGKAKRVRAVLSWAMENLPDAGGRLAVSLIGVIKGCGGFRDSSANFAGGEVIADAIEAFASEGYVLTQDGSLRPLLLDSLTGRELTLALAAYVRRAKRGAMDAALVTGTGKDLLEAVAILHVRAPARRQPHVSVLLEEHDAQRVLELRPGQAVVVPQGVWHRVLLNEPSQLVHITPGPGGQHRPLPRNSAAYQGVGADSSTITFRPQRATIQPSSGGDMSR